MYDIDEVRMVSVLVYLYMRMIVTRKPHHSYQDQAAQYLPDPRWN